MGVCFNFNFLCFQVGTGGGLVAVSRDMEAVHSFLGVSMTRKDMVAAVKDFIWDKSGDLAVKNSDTLKQSYSDNKNSDKSGNGNKVSPVRTPSRKEVMTRRYKIHMSDLEKALVYAISHEVWDVQFDSFTACGWSVVTIPNSNLLKLSL